MVYEVVRMFNKKTAIGIMSVIVLLSALGYMFFNQKEEEQVQVVEEKQTSEPVQVKKVIPKPVEIPVKKTSLYNSIDKKLPFSVIADLAFLPVSVRHTVEELLEKSDNGIYFLNSSLEKVVVLLDEEEEIKRHNFNFVEISLDDGNILQSLEDESDSKYDKWKYENDLPLSHTHYDENKEIVYTEVWNYSEDEPIKYKKTDKDGNVISIRKEVVENGINLREENLFYDNEGNMIKNVSFNYDATDLTRFTYYNSETPDESAMLVSEFEDGIKKKETLYSADYKVKNIYMPEYNDGQKSEIKILDKDNKLIQTLVE